MFGERWPGLKEALLAGEPSRTGTVVRENVFADPGAREAVFGEAAEVGLERCWEFRYGRDRIAFDCQGLRVGYVMDRASVLAARALPLAGATDVLDLCAAPGGKALILAERLGSDARLVLNDRSAARRSRLSQVLRDYLPRDVRERCAVIGRDGRRLGLHYEGAFDAVLLDAPCSSEQHVLGSPQALKNWSSQRIKRLSRDQYALLTSALLCLRPGGKVLYSTCALATDENDGVIERLLTRGRHPAEVQPLSAIWGERTRFGWQLLPDRDRCGPIYFCLLRKVQTGGAV